MKKTKILAYLATFMITLSIVLAGVLFTVYSLKTDAKLTYLKMHKETSKEDETNTIIALISKYEKAQMAFPDDYRINSKLGTLYEMLGNAELAEKNYKQALALSPYGVYSTYFDLANFYIKTDRLNDAEKTIKEIKNKRSKVIKAARGDFYINLGDAYFDKDDSENALRQYETALKFYKESKRKKKIDIATGRILDAFDAIAANRLENKRLIAAIAYLEKSLDYQQASYVYYKLAILYKDLNPVKSYAYMRKTYEIDPGLINYNIYEKVVAANIDYYEMLGNTDEAALFRDKLRIIRKFRERYLIKDGDFTIEPVSYEIKKGILNDDKTIFIKFRIKNNSHADTRTMFMQVNASYNGENDEVTNQRLFSKETPLQVLSESPDIILKYRFNDSITTSYTEKIRFDFYVAKKYNIRKLKIYSWEIDK